MRVRPNVFNVVKGIAFAATLVTLGLTLSFAAKPSRLDDAPKKKKSKDESLPPEKGMDWKGQHGGRPTPGHDIVSDERGWRFMWGRIGMPAPPAPDFKVWTAVIIHLGEKPTGGYTVDFLEPAYEPGGLVVRYRVSEPGGMATQAFTQPWRMRLFPKVKGELSVRSVK